MLKNLLFVAVGGSIGATLRYCTYLITAKFFAGTFPIATLSVNAIGSFIIGLLAILLNTQDSLKLFFIVGFLGSFTTFSSFSYETMQLINSKEFVTATANIILNFILCLAFVFIGAKTAKLLIL